MVANRSANSMINGTIERLKVPLEAVQFLVRQEKRTSQILLLLEEEVAQTTAHAEGVGQKLIQETRQRQKGERSLRSDQARLAKKQQALAGTIGAVTKESGIWKEDNKKCIDSLNTGYDELKADLDKMDRDSQTAKRTMRDVWRRFGTLQSMPAPEVVRRLTVLEETEQSASLSER